VYAPNSYGGPSADPSLVGNDNTWGYGLDDDMVRQAYRLREDDDDWSQPGTLVREVMDDAARDRLVENVSGHLLDGVSDKVLERAFAYWRSIDKETGDRIAETVGSGG
jgi:catalase